MNLERVEKIAEAVLYEGYMLYPYRASALKNQQRWNFGVLCPRNYSEAQNGSETWSMQTECLLRADARTQVEIRIRFLQIVDRSIGRLRQPQAGPFPDTEPDSEIVDRLITGGQTYSSWKEAAEREITVPQLRPASFLVQERVPFKIPAGRELEAIRDENCAVVGMVVRERQEISGSAAVELKDCGNGVFKATVGICNLSEENTQACESRAEVLKYSLISTHTILAAEDGEFISQLDPPEDLRPLVAGCSNIGTWPVLAGEEGNRSVMLSSPIILYDYPQIAPESPGSLFDVTEIDEILSLRIMAMTDEEKQEMRESDERARQILERTENMPGEQFMKLHGVLRGLRPASTAREAR